MSKETDLEKRTREEMESHTTGGPSAGVSMPARKVRPGTTEGYKFSQDTPVTEAKEVSGACLAAADKQIGLNKSKLTPETMPDCKE
jgi:hypothetical protein